MATKKNTMTMLELQYTNTDNQKDERPWSYKTIEIANLFFTEFGWGFLVKEGKLLYAVNSRRLFQKTLAKRISKYHSYLHCL